MAGLVPAIHVLWSRSKAWMPGTNPGMTEIVERSAVLRKFPSLHLNSGVPGTKASKAAQNWER